MSQLGQHDSERSFVRGFVLSAAAMFVPLGLTMAGVGGGWGHLSNRAFGAAIVWLWLLIPYWTQPPIAPSAVGAILAAVQWLVVATVIGVVTRRLRLLVASGAALVAVVATGGGVRLVLHALGYGPTFEGP